MWSLKRLILTCLNLDVLLITLINATTFDYYIVLTFSASLHMETSENLPNDKSIKTLK